MPAREFLLPDLGEGLEDAEVVRWLVAEGDNITLNQPLVEVDTAKALVEIPSPFAGAVTKLHAAEGDVVKVGAPLVTFEVEGEEEAPKRTAVLVGYGVEDSKTKRRRRLTNAGRSTSDQQADQRIAVPVEQGTVLAAPPVRKLAAELNVDLSTIKGSGPQGRITREDVLTGSKNALAAPPPSVLVGEDERLPVRGPRRLIAEKMTHSAREIPHVTTYITVDATAVLATRDRIAASSSLRITPLAVIAKAFIHVCGEHRKLNASYDADASELVIRGAFHLGIATDSERGLVVPVIKDASAKTIEQIAAEISELSNAVRTNKVKPGQLSGSTVTISNVGSFGAEFGTPIINHPESSILAVGLIQLKPVAEEGEILVKPQMVLSLSFDHRIIDGAEAGRAMVGLKELLENEDSLSRL
jgi:2-oxoisovalerate dehydrogenase E2 component (dihydrolipoyl transacylase)